MATKTLLDVPGVLTVTYHPDCKASVATWVTLRNEFPATWSRGITLTGQEGGLSWIVDLSLNPGAMSIADQEWLVKDGFKLWAPVGLKYQITVTPKSAIVRSSARRWSAGGEVNGVTSLDVPSIDEGLKFAKEQATKARASR